LPQFLEVIAHGPSLRTRSDQLKLIPICVQSRLGKNPNYLVYSFLKLRFMVLHLRTCGAHFVHKPTQRNMPIKKAQAISHGASGRRKGKC